MGGRIDVRADAAIAGRPGPGGNGPGCGRYRPGDLVPLPETAFAWALCRWRLAGAAQD